ARLPLQREAALTALLEVLSEEELAKERALAEEIRETDREIRRATSRTDRRLPYRAFMVTQYAVHIAVLATLLIVGVH
ncbi:hypothetical protein, partial [Nocardia brasiliensis]|uniref:hypothetical protein n=1 Tax=Nocardia brasiliensis TaxID=37326 RepID=UPI003D76D183